MGIEFFPVKRLDRSADLANISYQYQKSAALAYEKTTNHNFSAGLTNELSISVFLVL
ncbi:hypothetical protein ADIARSV_3431 [Arcticibacter svalbardensis MN12-7]|uniref:Uncharacterized protein n=1 Tax=Arcticibacter svalbardensis MN12-7 TaxID=1150600 RepID=R9GND2_9SPHI|nr:hypothetical protein ADIARSV_3431 [Arcticibacter svalbardensis MN12-7]